MSLESGFVNKEDQKAMLLLTASTPNRIGIMGFSAGGHLAAMAVIHFEHDFIENKKGIGLRPDFMLLIYPVISLSDSIGHIGSRNYLLGTSPSKEHVRFFSN